MSSESQYAGAEVRSKERRLVPQMCRKFSTGDGGSLATLREKPSFVPQQGQIRHKEKKQALFLFFFSSPAFLCFFHLNSPQIDWC